MTSAIVVVAHPDDETLWMGGTILQNKDWNWTVLSLCRRSDSDRMPKFLKVCSLYNAKPIILDCDDEELKPLELNSVISEIKKALPAFDYDYVFTHGENGEYGHIRHLEVHRALKKMVEEGNLKAKNFFFFNYEKGVNEPYPDLVVPLPISKSDFIVSLTEDELNLKRKIIKDMYGYPNEKGFELMVCKNKMETFKKF